MYKKTGGIFFILALVCQVFVPGQAGMARAEAAPAVVINEVAWMGTASSSADEWIELYNSGSEDAGLEGWTLTAADGTPAIDLSGTSTAGGYFLLERTDDESVPDIAADLIYAGALGNSGETLELRDGDGNLIDSVISIDGAWPAGDNATKRTMERRDDGGWQTSANPGGTPRAQNSGGMAPPPLSVCGNGVIEAGEECDDGNTAGGDGCGAACMAEQATDEEEATTTPDASGDNEGGDDNDNEAETSVSTPLATLTKLGAVVINEFVSDPADSDTEWVEIFNTTDKEVELAGWVIEEGSGKKTELSGRLGTNGTDRFSVVTKPKGNLNNAGDLIILRDTGGVLVDQVAYGNWDDGRTGDNAPVAKDPWSVARKIDGYESYNNSSDFVVTATPTRGETNLITDPEAKKKEKKNEISTTTQVVSRAPVVDFSFPEKITVGVPAVFDSSDTTDEDGDELGFTWDFGDGVILTLASPEHTFLAAGQYAVKLTVSDGEHEAVKEKTVTVAGADGDGEDVAVLGWRGEADAGRITLNEFMPDPEGSDTAEWIELYNDGETAVNLLDWRLDDEEGGSRPFTFRDAFWLDAGEYLVVSRAESGIALNNGGDKVRLFDGTGELAEDVGYNGSETGMSYARGLDNKWYWTTMPTPGKPNIILGDGGGKASVSNTGKTGGTTAKKSAAAYYVATTLEEMNNFDVGDLVRVSGTVAVLPGILGSQYFYVTATSGIQVYSYKKDFPELAVGDLIEVKGEISESGGEKRIKTKTAADMAVIAHGEAPVAAEIACAEVGDETVGRLVTLTGEIVKKSGSSIFLDDGTEEAEVYLKKTAGLGTVGLNTGETIAVTGLVGRTTSGARILPRSNDDIVKQDSATDEGRVLGETAVADEWALAARDRKMELFKYLFILAGGAIIVLLGLLWRRRK